MKTTYLILGNNIVPIVRNKKNKYLLKMFINTISERKKKIKKISTIK